MADFRIAYSNLIKAIWADPNVEREVSKDPKQLLKYGFDRDPPPTQVGFAPTSGPDTAQGFDDLKKQFENTSNQKITFYIPPKPSQYKAPVGGAGGVATQDSCCCCCSCPCCCCT
jgi:hypothetical protein